MTKVLVDTITGPTGPPGPPGQDAVLDPTVLRNIDCIIRYAGVQPARSSGTTDTLRRVRWVSDTEPQVGTPYAIDGDVWEDTTGVITPPPTPGTIIRSTPKAPLNNYWTGTPNVFSGIVIPAGAVLVVESSDTSDNGGASSTSLPILTNSGTARTWSRMATGMSSPSIESRIFVDYWYNDTGVEVTLDLTVTWGPSTPASNFSAGCAFQLLEGVVDPSVTAPKFAVVNNGTDLAAAITPDIGDQVLMAFVLNNFVGTFGTDYLSGTSADVSAPASLEENSGAITHGWVFRTAQEIAASPVTVGMNTPDPAHPLAVAVAFSAPSL